MVDPEVVIEAAGAGRVITDFVLAHGADPVSELRARGWLAGPPSSVRSASDPAWRIVVSYDVMPAGPESSPTPGQGVGRRADGVLRDADLTDADVAGAVVRLRVAAYALVSSARGLLLTELSERTSVPGRWNLPGGGIDAGESVPAALDREVWEETGQRVESVRLLDLVSDHWVGRAPNRTVEDYHAVRLIHTATCPDPSDPVINDVGGSTSDARWVPWGEVGQMPLADNIAPLVRGFAERHLAGS